MILHYIIFIIVINFKHSLKSAKSPLKHTPLAPSPYNPVWAINILKNHYNIEMNQEKTESEQRILTLKWKIRKIRSVKPFFKKKSSLNKINEKDLKDIPENSKEDNFNSLYLNEYQFPNFPKDLLQEINKFNDEVFYRTMGNSNQPV